MSFDILTLKALFHKATNLSDFANTEPSSTLSDAFRSPVTQSMQRRDGLRLAVHANRPLNTTLIQPQGFLAWWSWLFPGPTTVELSGRINLSLSIYPTHVQVLKRRWFGKSSLLARFDVSIPVFDEIGDQPVHEIRIRSALAFLYPFVPMHVEVSIDDQPIFSQGKFSVG